MRLMKLMRNTAVLARRLMHQEKPMLDSLPLDNWTDPSGAVISDCGLYRYRLYRRWGAAPASLFVMLNPSTADAERNDPTIRRCMDFARGWGRGGIHVVNLFALRTTSPKTMMAAADPVGPDNEYHVKEAYRECVEVICAWGSHGRYRRQDRVMLDWLREAGSCQPYALKITKSGQPGHPLYLPKDAEILPFCGSVFEASDGG